MQIHFCSKNYNQPLPLPTLTRKSQTTQFGRSTETSSSNTSYQVGKFIGSSVSCAALFAGVGALLNQAFPSLNANSFSLAIVGSVIGPFLSHFQEENEEEGK